MIPLRTKVRILPKFKHYTEGWVVNIHQEGDYVEYGVSFQSPFSKNTQAFFLAKELEVLSENKQPFETLQLDFPT
jgi:hypothetical protein